MNLSSLLLITLGLYCSSVDGKDKSKSFFSGAAGALAIGGVGLAGIAATKAVMGSEQQKAARIDFTVPNAQSVWECGKNYTVSANTFEIGSFFGTSGATLTLKHADGTQSATFEIWNGQLKEIINEERTLAIGSPLTGELAARVTLPRNIGTGPYMIEFESSNALNLDSSRIVKASPAFNIVCGGRIPPAAPMAPTGPATQATVPVPAPVPVPSPVATQPVNNPSNPIVVSFQLPPQQQVNPQPQFQATNGVVFSVPVNTQQVKLQPQVQTTNGMIFGLPGNGLQQQQQQQQQPAFVQVPMVQVAA